MIFWWMVYGRRSILGRFFVFCVTSVVLITLIEQL